MDLAAEIEYRMRRLGADREAFETIVASGERSALPHAQPTSRRIQPNQLLLIDMGANVAGYASDMTRTHAVGKPTAQARRMYRAVLESQLAAIDAVKPGVSCASVDRAARYVLYALTAWTICSSTRRDMGSASKFMKLHGWAAKKGRNWSREWPSPSSPVFTPKASRAFGSKIQ